MPTLALCAALPVVLGGLTHVAVLKARLWPALARVPLDGGATLRGRRVFGDNKTVRGLVVMVAATALWTAALAQLGVTTWVDHARVPAMLWGAALGLGYIGGELPNSFLKRQLGIAPGAAATGPMRPLLWVLDQIDSLGGALLAMWLLSPPPLGVVAWLLAITLVVHPSVAFIMKALGLKDRVG